MTASFTQTAFSQLQTSPVNFTGDPLQTTMAFSGLLVNLQQWTLRVANALNMLIPNGGPVPVSQGGTGEPTLGAHSVLVGEGTNPVHTVGPGATGIPLIGQGALVDPIFGTAVVAGGGTGVTSLTAHGVLIGEGTSAVNVTAAGAGGIPLIGQGVADPVFGTAVVSGGGTGTTSFSPANALILSGVTSAGALQASQNWQQSASVTGQLIGNFNIVNVPSTITGLSGADLIIQGSDSNPSIITQIAYAGASQNQCYRAEGSGASPTATGAGQTITSIQARGYDGTNWLTTNMAIFRLMTQNQTSSTDHSSQAQLLVTPKGSTTSGLVATFQAAGDGGQVFAGNTSGSTVASGNVGEYLSTVTAIGSEVSINSAANVATLVLTAGDWDVWGELWVDLQTGGATASASPSAGITTTSATLPTGPADGTARTKPGVTPTATGTTSVMLPVGPVRSISSSSVTYFLVGLQGVSAGTANGYGKICARRRQ